MAKTILVIDDDRLVLKTLAKYLKSCGYSVIVASSGIEALEKIETNIPDLIISDIRMPGLSGIETIKKIRGQMDNNKKPVPAVIITGYAGDEPYREDEALGIADCLYKPFEIDEFIKIVKKNLEPIPTYTRAHPRILATFPVKLQIKGLQSELPSEVIGETMTISEGGVSISTVHKMPLNLQVNVSLDFSPAYSPISADARIVWSEAKEAGGKYYYGLQFSAIGDNHISILREIFNKHKLLSDQFISLTKELKEFVQSFKYKFDEFDKAHNNDQERIDFLNQNKEETFVKLTNYFSQIWGIVNDFDRVRYVIHKDYYQRELGYLLLDPIEINRRIYQKPLGYPGDFVIMNYIYDYSCNGRFLGNSSYEKIINSYTCNIPVSLSNVARKDFLKEIIIETIDKNKTSKIISLGCGSARELIEVLEEGRISKPTLFKCFDLEKKALEYIEDSIERISSDKKRFLTINYLHRDITSIIRDKRLREEIQDNNIIYLSGVYDYLSDKMAERLCRELYALLGDGGKLIICNISLENNSHRAYYELLGEWCMIHRTKNEMLGWLDGSVRDHSEFAHPPDGGRYNFLVIKK